MGKKFAEDLSGRKFGRWTVLYRDEDYICYNGYTKPMWRCKCECGTEKTILSDNLRRGKSLSCGCLRVERANEAKYTARHNNERLYNIWQNIKIRCYNSNSKSYADYGGRGIIMCDEWKNDFSTFCEWALKSGYDKSLSSNECSIDRIDSNGNYCPENCRWTDKFVQNSNKRNNILITIDGETCALKEWCRRFNANYKTVHSRIKYSNWDPIEALQYYKR